MAGGAVQQWGSQHMEIERCEAPVSPLGMVSSTASPAGGTQLRPDPPATELSRGGYREATATLRCPTTESSPFPNPRQQGIS